MPNFASNSFFFSLIEAKPIYTVILWSLSFLNTACKTIGTILLVETISLALHREPLFWISRQLLAFKMLDSEWQNSLIILIASLFIIILLKNMAAYLSTIVAFWQTRALVYSWKTQAIETLAQANIEYYRRHKTEDILLQLNREIERGALAIKSIQKILIVFVIIAILTVILLVISWQLTLISLVILGSIIAIDNWLIARTQGLKFAALKATQLSNRQLIEFLTGIRSIKAVVREIEASGAIAKSWQQKDRLQLTVQLVAAAAKPLTEIGAAILVLILITASYYLYAGAISIITSALLIYLIILFQLLPLLNELNIAKQQYFNTRSSIKVVFNLLALKKENPRSRQQDFAELTTGITFKAVTVTDIKGGKTVLDKINLEIPERQTIALVGLQPKSSSALVDLLYQFSLPTEGSIWLDDRELSAYSTKSWRQAIAVVSHDTFLFNNSLAENIAYGSDASAADIATAAKQAKIYRFIEQLPAGMATKVGEAGISLTPLQKLQIGLARAFLRQSKIIIFNEPFHNIERMATIESIKKLVLSLCRDRTALIITQQIELAKAADSILVFRRGKIVETGTHEQLLKQGNIYPRLCSMQFKINRQSRQLKLAQKIARKLAQRNNSSLAREIQTNLNTLLNSLEILNQGWFNNDPQENIIFDESFQSAKNILENLKKYESRLDRQNDENDC